MAHIRRTYGEYTADIRRIYGEWSANIRQTCGERTPNTAADIRRTYAKNLNC